MRIRVGRTLRLVIVLAFLILMVPLLMFKLESVTSESRSKTLEYDLPEEKQGIDVFEKLHRPLQRAKNASLQPVMSDSLGNYEPKDLPPRTGPGEGGVPVILTPSEEREAQRTITQYGFNMVASDKISMDRRIKDTRPDECKNWIYPSTPNLPTASVILVFYDEGWGVLLRTVHSVINTSPPELLKEVVLVDDGSGDGEHV